MQLLANYKLLIDIDFVFQIYMWSAQTKSKRKRAENRKFNTHYNMECPFHIARLISRD